MPQRAWSDKRERQYEHIKEGLLERGESEDTAEEIAARTVNKERARAGEAQAVEPHVDRRHLVGPPRWAALARGPGRPHPRPALQRGPGEGIKGRSKMNKAQLETRRRALSPRAEIEGERGLPLRGERQASTAAPVSNRAGGRRCGTPPTDPGRPRRSSAPRRSTRSQPSAPGVRTHRRVPPPDVRDEPSDADDQAQLSR